MSYRIPLATFLLLALGATPAQAQQDTPASCVRPGPQNVYIQRADLDQIAGENRCIQDLSEGLAAVILYVPAQRDVYNDAGAADSLVGHRWGYIDAQGKLAIEPRYEEARPFRHGLAAVKENGLWGYIDKSGQWALLPQWEQAGNFSLAGVAMVQANGRTGLIDASGASVTPSGLGRNVSTIELDGGSPTRAIIGYRREYLSATGVRRYVDGNQRVLAQLGNGPFYVATSDGEHQGLLDADWRWVLRPEYDEIIAALPDGVGAVRKGEAWYFLDSQTGKAGSERYRHLETLRDNFWLALPETTEDTFGSNPSYQLLNAQGKVLLPSIAQLALSNLTFAGKVLLYRTADTLTAYPTGGQEPLVLPVSWQPRETYGDYLLFYDENETLAGIVTPAGQLQKIASSDPLSQVREVDVQADRLWLFGEQQRVLNIIDKQGRRLLNDTARETLANSSYRLLPLTMENAPLAILTTGYCHCEEGGAGLVLNDGRAVRHPDWTEVILLHEEADLETLENIEDLRFAAVSENGMVMLDAQGNPVQMEPLQHIAPFRHGYALGYAKGVAYLVQADGKRLELPDYFDVRIVGPNRMAIVMEAAEGSLWGLDEIPYYRQLVAPQFLEIGNFQDGLAPARSAEGVWGLINEQGNWAVQPEYDEVARERSGYWLLRRRTDDKNYSYDWPAVVVSRAGKILTPPLRSLQVQEYGNGYAMVGNSLDSWIVGPDGSAFRAGAADISQIGDWLEVRRDAEAGVLDGKGNWVVPPAPVFLSQVRDQRVMRRTNEGSELLDASGKQVASLGDSNWQWLPGSRYLAGLGYDEEREPVTRFADANGKIVATVKGHALGFDGERIITANKDGAYRWLDKTGQPVGEAHHMLGMLHDGLAGAMGPDGKHAGYVDNQSTYRIPPAYLAVSRFQDGRAVASTAQASYLLDTSGRPLAWVADECGMRILRNAAGKAIWPAEQSLSYCY